ncbi:MAG TPA: MerR family transcriptional regulator [Myxococcota bacterium]|nr:MerR family transcriptional regulator [Myxococcota bacterium]
MSKVDNDSLPDKIYFKIGEVSEIVGVEPYVLRYWESEFPALKPNKSRSQQRMYRKRDVELLLKIKKLLYEDMYTIAGAKKQLSRSGEKSASPQMSLTLPQTSNSGLLKKIEKELKDLSKLVDETT